MGTKSSPRSDRIGGLSLPLHRRGGARYLQGATKRYGYLNSPYLICLAPSGERILLVAGSGCDMPSEMRPRGKCSGGPKGRKSFAFNSLKL